MLENADRTNKIITGTKQCIASTDKCMWKHLNNVPNGVKTRSKTKNEPTVAYQEIDRYFVVKYFIY